MFLMPISIKNIKGNEKVKKNEGEL